MLSIKNVEILKNEELVNGYYISHVFKQYTSDSGKLYYCFIIGNKDRSVNSNIKLEKQSSKMELNIDIMYKANLYELSGPAGKIDLKIEDIKNKENFINKMKLLC